MKILEDLIKKANDLGHNMGAWINFYDEYKGSCCQNCPKLIHVDNHGNVKTSAKGSALNHTCK